MATLEIFNNVPEISKEEPKVEMPYNFFDIKQEKKEEECIPEEINNFILNIKEKPEEPTSFQFINSAPYFGKTFEYLGYWEENKIYYNDAHRLSFISYDNCLLACNKTHVSSKESIPVIQYDETKKPIAVENIFWSLVITGINNSESVDDITRELLALQASIRKNSLNISENEKTISVIGKNLGRSQEEIKDLQTTTKTNSNDIKTIKEKLDGNISYPWIGTEDEYASITEIDPNKFYYLYEEE